MGAGRVMRMGAKERANAVRILTDGRAKLRAVPVKARVRYAVSLIVCDPDGSFSLGEVELGMADERITALAQELLKQAGAL